MSRLLIFDLDGTLIESFLEERICGACGGTGEDVNATSIPELDECQCCRGTGVRLYHREQSYDDIIWLPDRLDTLKTIAKTDRSVRYHIATNQSGVHYGFQTEAQVMTKLQTVCETITAATWPYRVTCSVALAPGPLRKPNPGMLYEGMQRAQCYKWDTTMVGDMEVDRQAAEAARVSFIHADHFFHTSPAAASADGSPSGAR